jgi:hypothetical protein
VCIGHFGETYDERQQRFIRPSVLGKSLPSRLSATLNLVGYLHATPTERGIRRELVFGGATNILTKPHSSLRNIEYANLDFIMAKVSGVVGRDTGYPEWRKGSESTSLAPEEQYSPRVDENATGSAPVKEEPIKPEEKSEDKPAKKAAKKKGSAF